MQEKGYPFLIENQPHTLHGTIATISADNPASCALGGFKESTSANRMCRQCMATQTDASEKVCYVLLINYNHVFDYSPVDEHYLELPNMYTCALRNFFSVS